jgi:Zn-dependent protease with chaperone function
MITFWEIVSATLAKPETILIMGACWGLAVLILWMLKLKSVSLGKKVGLVYLHLLLILAPFFYLTYDVGCAANAVNYTYCGSDKFFMTMPYLVAGSAILAAIAGMIVLPHYYKKGKTMIASKHHLRILRNLSKKIDLRSPKLYYVDGQEPMAYSFTGFFPSIYITVGMLELLSKKELESVLYHELYHIKNRSALFKMSSLIVRTVSPIAAFGTLESMQNEEADADSFAASLQNTARYLSSAKAKVQRFSEI